MMEFITILSLAVALAMDAFAVSIAAGTLYQKLHIRHSLRMAAYFGGFQAVMPIIGWAAGQTFAPLIQTWTHWLAAGILAFIGAKMLFEAFEITKAEKNINPESLLIVVALAIATSLDALAVGLTLALITHHILTTVIVIGIVTFVLSWLGCLLGQKIGHCFEIKLEIVGGVILLLIAGKIILENLAG